MSSVLEGMSIDEVKQAIAVELLASKEVFALTKGNPDAIVAIGKIFTDYAKIDPRAVFGAQHAFDFFNDNRFTPTAIGDFYKYVCSESTFNAVVVIRSLQMGLISGEYVSKLAGGMGMLLVFDIMNAKLVEAGVVLNKP